jgi:hypothetical protein
MKVAAVISADGQTVMPLVEGPVIRIRDTDSGVETDVPNPAVSAQRARRMAALQELMHQDVTVVVNPPETFCAHSYQVAKDNELQFWNVPAGTTWESLWQDARGPAREDLVSEISAERLATHNHHHHH